MAQLAKHALFGAAVMAATGVPYAVHTATGSKPAATASTASHATQPHTAAPGTANTSHESPYLESQSNLPPEGQPVGIAEVLNFDVKPDWVRDRWPRVLTSWGGGDVQVYRVPLVTGKRPDDLAGSLSYSFDTKQQLRKIEFTGVTGNARTLITHLTSQHGFIAVATGNPGVHQYQVQSGGQAMSQLTVHLSHVVQAAQSHGSQSVELVMRKPAESRWLSEAKIPLDTIRWP